jgi:hypothetical protein
MHLAALSPTQFLDRPCNLCTRLLANGRSIRRSQQSQDAFRVAVPQPVVVNRPVLFAAARLDLVNDRVKDLRCDEYRDQGVRDVLARFGWF